MRTIVRNLILLLLTVPVLSGCNRVRKASDYELWGLDVSKHQKHIDWLKVAENERPYFVFIKATEGTLIVDPMYGKHARDLDEAGILWGAYHFFGHRTSGKAQARNFIKTAGLRKGNLFPVLDIEKHRFMKDPRKTVKEAKAFCREIRRYYGINPIIYCSSAFYEHYLKDDFSEDDYTLWIADYSKNPSHLRWHFWQHTDSHSIQGIRGSVDRNVFDGDTAELRKLIL
ncbi:MAG: hypothetical protein IJC16_10235 [Rikenellaceae bacterium]|nr:hypothetical protein [Rikenellaceae bacterium]